MKFNKLLTIKYFVLLAVSTLLFTASAKDSFAREICFEQYGGGEECYEYDDSDLKVEKEVWNPKIDDWASNIEPEDSSDAYLFDPEETIKFRIKVKNVGDITIEDINLKDILPSYVKYSSGDGDGEDGNTKVEFDEFDLDPGESESFEFKAEVADDGILPKDDYLCLTNIAKAEGTVEDTDDELDDVDYANFCIDLPGIKSKETISKLPTTGTFDEGKEKYILILSLSAGLMLIGYGVKKIAED